MPQKELKDIRDLIRANKLENASEELVLWTNKLDNSDLSNRLDTCIGAFSSIKRQKGEGTLPSEKWTEGQNVYRIALLNILTNIEDISNLNVSTQQNKIPSPEPKKNVDSFDNKSPNSNNPATNQNTFSNNPDNLTEQNEISSSNPETSSPEPQREPVSSETKPVNSNNIATNKNTLRDIPVEDLFFYFLVGALFIACLSGLLYTFFGPRDPFIGALSMTGLLGSMLTYVFYKKKSKAIPQPVAQS